MKFTLKNICISLIMSFVILICYNCVSNKCVKCEPMINIIPEPTVWKRNMCNYGINGTLKDELEKHNIQESMNDKFNLYFPCAYDDIDKELEEMPQVDGAKYFIIEGGDLMVAKEWLWINVVSYYGLDITKTMMPNSYVLTNSVDLIRFDHEFTNDKIYIMKKNIQRQEGLKITNDRNEIINSRKNGYVVVQELLQDPYLISGRKTNMRFYVLVMSLGNEINVHVYNDGFMYYTKDLFKKNSLETGPNITTGYIDRKIYKENPLTHDDLKKYLDSNRNNLLQAEKDIRSQKLLISDVYFTRIYDLLKNIFAAFNGKICLNNKFNKTNLTFQLFGVDIAMSDTLNPTIMEINKGPDMGAKDKRDSNLKHSVVRNVLNIIGAIDANDDYDNVNNFIEILKIKNS